MSTRLALCALVLACGCGNSPQDAAPDANAPDCPSALPQDHSACTAPNAQCSYGATSCECESPSWICRPAACPFFAGGNFSAPCPLPGLQCDYDFETSYLCVAPEDQWVRCQCPAFGEPVNGAPCCVSCFNCACTADHHLLCNPVDGGATD